MNYRFIALAGMAFATASLMADVKLPALFSNGAVLQRSGDTPVFGTADQGEEVTVKLGDISGSAKAGADGKWLVKLDLSKSGPGPFSMAVEGKNKLALSDILVGEVWLCSGQSNMEWRAGRVINAKEELAASGNPMIRCFTVQKATSAEPIVAYRGNWQAASPETTGNFTAVGYFFARELQKELGVPVGIVNSSWGGTPIEAWTSREGIDAFADQKKNADRMDDGYNSYDERLKKYVDDYAAWQEKFKRRENDLQLKDAGEWKAVKSGNIPGNGGVVMLRQEIKLDGKKTVLNIGRINAACEILLNGKKVGEISLEKAIASYGGVNITIPEADVKNGANELVIRFFSAIPGINRNAGSGYLSSNWEYAYLGEFPALTDAEKKEMPRSVGFKPRESNLPARLFNAMINPMVPYGFAGAIWYQGESNAGRPQLYAEATKALVEDWRKQFGKDFSFYWCQLANFQSKTTNPDAPGWALLREAQTKALEVPKTGQAILIDIGESGDIHPLNKQDVGKRLAAVALAKDYGKKIPYSGPMYKSMKVEDGKIRLSFDFIEGGLVAEKMAETYPVKLAANQTNPVKRNSPDSELEGFAVAGEDGKWFWADAKIDGDTVLVWSDKVKEPTQVRYAWSNNPDCNLYNKAVFPAVPFRTNK